MKYPKNLDHLNLSPEVQCLIDAVWQVLDDMGKDGRSCCESTKAGLRFAYEPFVIEGDEFDYPLEEAKEVLRSVGMI